MTSKVRLTEKGESIFMSEKKRKRKENPPAYLTAGKTTQNLGKVILIPWRTRKGIGQSA